MFTSQQNNIDICLLVCYYMFTRKHIIKKEVFTMIGKLTNTDIKDGEKISFIFANLSEESKLMAIVYLSALRDKEIADGTDDTNSTKLA